MTIVVCDVGGTHVRFAHEDDKGHLTTPVKLRVADFKTLQLAVGQYLQSQFIAAENVSHFYLSFSNRNNWVTADLRLFLPKASIRQVNDFEANAYGILTADDDQLQTLNQFMPRFHQDSSSAVIGVGTGLGLAYIVGPAEKPYVQRTHGGHMLPAMLKPEHATLFHEIYKVRQAHTQDDTISIYEDVLSGRGLFSAYEIVCRINHGDRQFSDIETLLLSGGADEFSKVTFALFSEILGVFAHHTLAFGHAYNALYLTGGVIDRMMLGGLFDIKAFMAGLYLNTVPIVKQDVTTTPLLWVKDEFISLKGLLMLAREEGGVA